MAAENILPSLVDRGKVAQVGKKNIQFNDIAQIATGGCADRLRLSKTLANMDADIPFNQLHGLGSRGICPDR